jgi:hypothetical protein
MPSTLFAVLKEEIISSSQEDTMTNLYEHQKAGA